MYGLTPSMIIEKEESPPPEKIFKKPRKLLLDKATAKAPLSTPGIGIEERNLTIANIKTTKSILFLKTLSCQILFRVFIF